MYLPSPIARPSPESAATPTPAPPGVPLPASTPARAVSACTVHLRDTFPLPANPPEPTVTLALGKSGLEVDFAITDPNIIRTRSLSYNTLLEVLVFRTNTRAYVDGLGTPEHPAEAAALTAAMDANGACQSINRYNLAFREQHQQCKGAVKPCKPPDPKNSWCGSLALDYAALDSALGGDESFGVTIKYVPYVRVTNHVGNATVVTLDNGNYCGVPLAIDASPRLACRWPMQRSYLQIAREPVNPLTQGYVAAGGDFGNIPGMPPHRIVTNVWSPLGPNDLVAATFSDDSGKVLQLRDSATAAIVDAGQAKSLRCVSCGTFQTDDTQPFDPALTSTNVLGVDLSSLGVDSGPFRFKATTFPIDSGYKLAHAGNAILGATAFNGTTALNGVARDSVFQYADTFYAPSGGARLGIDVYDVTTNRSMLSPAATGFYPVADPVSLHTANSQLSLGYALSPPIAEPLLPYQTFAALFRYGTQYVPDSQTLDIAFSSLQDPAVIDVAKVYGRHWRPAVALGYRDVGAAYLPNDGVYDTHAGMHGLYGVFELTNPTCFQDTASPACENHTKPLDLKVTGYRFSDALQARDVSLNLDFTYPFFDTFSLHASSSNASISVLEAGRATGIAITDVQGGGAFLPNSQYTITLNYAARTGSKKLFELSGGYSQAELQNCIPSIFAAPPPCFAYRSPAFSGNLYWVPFGQKSNVFLTATSQNSSNEPFRTGQQLVTTAAGADLFDTTATHEVRTAGIGAHVINPCSTVLVTASNRGGVADSYGKSPPQPGLTETASAEFVPPARTWLPALLVAYSRIINTYPTPTSPNQTSFLVRLQFGVPFDFGVPQSYTTALAGKCSAAGS